VIPQNNYSYPPPRGLLDIPRLKGSQKPQFLRDGRSDQKIITTDIKNHYAYEKISTC